MHLPINTLSIRTIRMIAQNIKINVAQGLEAYLVSLPTRSKSNPQLEQPVQGFTPLTAKCFVTMVLEAPHYDEQLSILILNCAAAAHNAGIIDDRNIPILPISLDSEFFCFGT